MKKHILLSESTYPGGKGCEGVYQKIINQFPPHKIYVEGFLGLGSILRIKKPASINLGFEKNKQTYSIWQGAKYQNEQLTKSNLSVSNLDFFDVLFSPDKYYLNNENTLLYLDPPYPISSRQQKKRIYKHELTDEQHYIMLNIIKNLNCLVAISTYPNSIYEEVLSSWRKIEYLTQTRGKSHNEVLYMNYAEPKQLHQYDFLGNDYREREAINRRYKNMILKLQRMDSKERGKIFEHLKQEYDIISNKNAVEVHS